MISRFGYRVSTLHGFGREEYGTVITDMLGETAFVGDCQLALTDIWMKITLRKPD